MTTWYNEIDRYAAQWLRNLGASGHIADGLVDERPVETLRPEDVIGERAHFFAGIGGWDYALRLAGWPADRPVWTGSCPCQPFSVAGKRGGADDPRHLWPAWFRLIRECRPDTIFGEQVASAIGHGWLDGVFADLEAEGYTCGAVVLGAHSVGAPHIRQRLWWAAYADDRRAQGKRADDRLPSGEARGSLRAVEDGRMAHTEQRAAERHGHALAGEAGGVQGATRQQRLRDDAGDGEPVGGLGDATRQRRDGAADTAGQDGRASTQDDGRLGDAYDARPQGHGQSGERAGERSPWQAGELIPCLDGLARRAQPGVFPLAHGVPGRVGRLRAYGNAIVPQVAAVFVRAFMETAGV